MIYRAFATAFFLAAAFPIFAASQSRAKTSSSAAKPSPHTISAASDGERAFRANCGRCHNPPEQLSPSSVPAVVLHMRVRAMLPEKDAQAIIHFLAP